MQNVYPGAASRPMDSNAAGKCGWFLPLKRRRIFASSRILIRSAPRRFFRDCHQRRDRAADVSATKRSCRQQTTPMRPVGAWNQNLAFRRPPLSRRDMPLTKASWRRPPPQAACRLNPKQLHLPCPASRRLVSGFRHINRIAAILSLFRGCSQLPPAAAFLSCAFTGNFFQWKESEFV